MCTPVPIELAVNPIWLARQSLLCNTHVVSSSHWSFHYANQGGKSVCVSCVQSSSPSVLWFSHPPPQPTLSHFPIPYSSSFHWFHFTCFVPTFPFRFKGTRASVTPGGKGKHDPLNHYRGSLSTVLLCVSLMSVCVWLGGRGVII